MIKYYIKYNEEGGILGVSPNIKPELSIEIPEAIALKFNSGEESFRNWVIDTTKKPKLKRKEEQQDTKVEPFYNIPKNEIASDLQIIYNGETLKIFNNLSAVTGRALYITEKNNPVKLFKIVKLNPEEATSRVEFHTEEDFSIFVWRTTDEDIGITYEEA